MTTIGQFISHEQKQRCSDGIGRLFLFKFLRHSAYTGSSKYEKQLCSYKMKFWQSERLAIVKIAAYERPDIPEMWQSFFGLAPSIAH